MIATLCVLLTVMFERIAFYGILAGLVLFCTSNLQFDQTAATSISLVFSGFVYFLPVVGGFLADSYIGRYRTIFICYLIYNFGTVLIPASAVDYSSWGMTPANMTQRRIMFLTGLILVALATGGIRANMGPFGADQVEASDKGTLKSFFNWFYWIINLGGLLGFTLVAYVQQEISFAWGFFISTVCMLLATLVLFLGLSEYRFTEPKGSIVGTAWGICGEGSCKDHPEPNPNLPEGSEQKYLARSKKSFGGSYEDHLVDGVTSVMKVVPFCALSIMYWAVYAQMNNTFFAQAERMDVRMGNGVNVPVAALTAFNAIAIIILIPFVDKVIYPCFEHIGLPLSYLKRIGIGMSFAVASVLLAGIVEVVRKKLLNSENGSHTQVLAGETFIASSLNVFVQIPQLILMGISEIFASVAMIDIAYNQAPVAMQGILNGLFFASIGAGSWLSTALLSIVEAATKDDPWWSHDINNSKMENLMFLLAALLMINTIIFIVVAHFYTYQDPSQFEPAKYEPEEQNDDMLDGIWLGEED